MKKIKLIIRLVPMKYRKMIFFIASAVVASGLFSNYSEILQFLKLLIDIFSF